jgi:4-hydroxy-2-oxoheptanedioate aldolase
MNRVKTKLKGGGTVLVLNPNFPSAALVEHAAELGFDVAFIDCEHGTADFERVEEMARAARAGGITTILRPWSQERGLVTRYLDCGVGGIQFPAVDSAAKAREAVEIVRDARGEAFDDTLVAVMIESREGVRDIEEIVAVPGIDAAVVGLADLARAYGHAGQREHPDVTQAIDRIITAACATRAVAAGYNLHQWEQARALQAKGVRWFTIHARGMLRRAHAELTGLLTSSSG